MIVRITKLCSIRLNGETRELKPSETLEIEAGKAERIINAGLAVAVTPDAATFWETVKAFEESNKTGGQWEWITSRHPELWKKHISALWSGDMTIAYISFNEMVNAWSARI